jgi:hypothetical protein
MGTDSARSVAGPQGRRLTLASGKPNIHPPGKSLKSVRQIELLPVCFPPLANASHDRLVFRINPQLVVGFVALEPRIVHISQLDRPSQPLQRRLPLSKKCINSSQIVRDIAVDDVFRPILE